MAGLKSFEEIIAWQKSRELCNEIYKVTSEGTFSTDFRLADQVRRAAISVMSNIAEGFDRRGDKEFVRFLNISKGSLSEVKSHLYIAFDLKYINADMKDRLFERITEVGKLLSGLIGYLKSELA
jgi:four helix bundle protein